MAKVKDFVACARDAAGRSHTEKFTINVNTKGEFSSTIPRKFVMHAKNAQIEIEKRHACSVDLEPKEKFTSLESSERFTATCLDFQLIELFLTEMMKSKLREEEKTEFVIGIHLGMRFSACQNKADKRILPNFECVGNLPENENRDHHAYWQEWESVSRICDKFDASKNGVLLDLGAAIYIKSTTTSGDQQKVTYAIIDSINDHLRGNNFKKLGPYGQLLSEMKHQTFNCNPHQNRQPQIEIPYTESAAAFLYELMMNMIHLGIALKQYIGDAETVTNTIQKFMSGADILGLPAPDPMLSKEDRKSRRQRRSS